MKKALAATAFSAFVAAGFIQQAGVVPVTALGNASVAAIEATLDLVVGEALACPGNGNGNGNRNSSKGRGRR
jgi:hypothetical protein